MPGPRRYCHERNLLFTNFKITWLWQSMTTQLPAATLLHSICLMNDFGYTMNPAQLPQTCTILSSFQVFMQRNSLRQKKKWFPLIVTFGTKPNDGRHHWLRSGEHAPPVRATHSTPSVHTLPFCFLLCWVLI